MSKSGMKRLALQAGGRYPDWICADCGPKYGRVIEGRLATWHAPDPTDPTDVCGWCNSDSLIQLSLTEPRDFGYPPMLPNAQAQRPSCREEDSDGTK